MPILCCVAKNSLMGTTPHCGHSSDPRVGSQY